MRKRNARQRAAQKDKDSAKAAEEYKAARSDAARKYRHAKHEWVTGHLGAGSGKRAA
eukprot:gene1952-5962_t